MTYLGLFQQNMLKSHSIQNKCDGQVHTAIFKMNHQQGPIEQHMELYTMLCTSLDWREVRGRMDTCISRAESLCCSPRRKWQPTPVFLPGESHGQRSLAGYSPRGRKESNTTEQFHFTFHLKLPQLC